MIYTLQHINLCCDNFTVVGLMSCRPRSFSHTLSPSLSFIHVYDKINLIFFLSVCDSAICTRITFPISRKTNNLKTGKWHFFLSILSMQELSAAALALTHFLLDQKGIYIYLCFFFAFNLYANCLLQYYVIFTSICSRCVQHAPYKHTGGCSLWCVACLCIKSVVLKL